MSGGDGEALVDRRGIVIYKMSPTQYSASRQLNTCQIIFPNQGPVFALHSFHRPALDSPSSPLEKATHSIAFASISPSHFSLLVLLDATRVVATSSNVSGADTRCASRDLRIIPALRASKSLGKRLPKSQPASSAHESNRPIYSRTRLGYQPRVFAYVLACSG